MSGETQPGPNGPWPVLDVQERRILGVLVEKQKTTSDSYPMSVNSLVAGCNQKSNRDPVLNLDEDDVEETLLRLMQRGLVERAPASGRVERWRHLLYPYLQVEKVDLAVLAELLLRGPQTEGELRTRASRMDPIDDLEALRGVLRPLVQRNLVVYLTPEDRRGAVLTHGFHDRAELAALRARAGGQSVSAPAHVPVPVPAGVPAAAPVQAPAVPVADERVPALVEALAAAQGEITALKQQVAELRGGLEGLRKELAELRQALGG